MLNIDPQGLLLGQRLRACSDEAQLHFPRLLAASNSYGRIRVHYRWILETAYAGFKTPPTKEQMTAWLHEYHSNFLLFVYQGEDGSKWGQFDAPSKCLGKYRLKRDTLESPAPPDGAHKSFKAAYIESLRVESVKKSADCLDIPTSLNKFPEIHQNFGNVSEKSQKFPHEVVVVVEVEKYFAPASPAPVQSLPSAEKKAERQPDPRHAIFKAALFGWWERTFGTGAEPPWDGSCGRPLDELLRSLPSLTVERFETCLRHRAESAVNTSEHPRKWLRNVTDYEMGPLDAYGKPKSLTKAPPLVITRRAPGPQETSVTLKRQDDAREAILDDWRGIRARGHPEYETAPRWVKEVLGGHTVGEVA